MVYRDCTLSWVIPLNTYLWAQQKHFKTVVHRNKDPCWGEKKCRVYTVVISTEKALLMHTEMWPNLSYQYWRHVIRFSEYEPLLIIALVLNPFSTLAQLRSKTTLIGKSTHCREQEWRWDGWKPPCPTLRLLFYPRFNLRATVFTTIKAGIPIKF